MGLLGRFQSSSFTPDINGIILAAHRDNYVILKLLLDRGERICKPHDLRCACHICTQSRRENGLQHSKLRINTYRALTSPSFILLTSNDPILTAFELSCELKKLGELENEFRTEYEELEAKCQKFATDMLAQTRSSAELSIVLNHNTGADVSNCHVNEFSQQSLLTEDISERMQLSRLKLAIRYGQKQVVNELWNLIFVDFSKVSGLSLDHLPKSYQSGRQKAYVTMKYESCICHVAVMKIGNQQNRAYLFEIVQSLYWSAYGLIDLTSFNLEYPHVFTEFVGKLTFGTYSYIAFIVLLNMLIAMMNNSYEQIVGQVDIEWKFARSKLWISYFGEGCTVPVPFNIIPTPKTFMYMLNSMKNFFLNCSKKKKLHHNHWETIRLRIKQVKECELRYRNVMHELTKRYIMQKLQSNENDLVSADDLSEIKGDISAFRHELLDILKSNGMKIPAYHKTVSKLRRGRETYQLSEIQEMVRGKKTKESIKRTSINHAKHSKPLILEHSMRKKITTSAKINQQDDNLNKISLPTTGTNIMSSNSGSSGSVGGVITGPVDNPAFENEEIIVNTTSTNPPIDLNGKQLENPMSVLDHQHNSISDDLTNQQLYPTIIPCTSTVICEETIVNQTDSKFNLSSNQPVDKQLQQTNLKQPPSSQLSSKTITSSIVNTTKDDMTSSHSKNLPSINETDNDIDNKSQFMQDIIVDKRENIENEIQMKSISNKQQLIDQKNILKHCKLNKTHHQQQKQKQTDDCSPIKNQRSDIV
ncbi:unnamed protein product [Schistosoma turkestanicum]|nr:unnamed protein product [Schistosoma turkestanicum]